MLYRLRLVTRLILNADDFGMTSGVNRSVVKLHRTGALTSATMMARAAATGEAVGEARANPRLGVGCHVVLVDGAAALPSEQIPSLAVASGAFRPTLGKFVRDLFLGRIRDPEIELEAVAQIRSLQAAGVRVTHIDTHKHTHMFPRVLRPVLRAALQCGVRAIRNPFEPDWALKATPGAPALRRAQVRLLRIFGREFEKLTSEAGVSTTDGAIGVLATGTLDARSVSSLLLAMPEGTWELVCHPGYVDVDLESVRTRLRESREVEREALAEVVPEFLGKRRDVTAIHFGDLG